MASGSGGTFMARRPGAGLHARGPEPERRSACTTGPAGSPCTAHPDLKDTEMIAAERTRGVFSRQLFLWDNLDTDRVKAEYDAGC
jgi:Hsp20/alpha crystallin family